MSETRWDSTSGMSYGIGVMMLLAGLGTAAWSFFLEITAPFSTVINMELLQIQQNVLIMGGIVAIVGALLMVAGKIPVARRSKSAASDRPTHAPPTAVGETCPNCGRMVEERDLQSKRCGFCGEAWGP